MKTQLPTLVEPLVRQTQNVEHILFDLGGSGGDGTRAPEGTE